MENPRVWVLRSYNNDNPNHFGLYTSEAPTPEILDNLLLFFLRLPSVLC
jgi:hypothetical protein